MGGIENLIGEESGFLELLQNVSAQKKPDGTPRFNAWEKLFDSTFCREMFGAEAAVLSGDKTTPLNWSKINITIPEDDVLQSLEEWLDTQLAPAIRINVYVGYAWQKVGTLRKDLFWCSLRNILGKTAQSLESQFRERNVCVRIKRLRASHGEAINEGIVQRIEDADVLIFDIAGRAEGADKHAFSGYNANVLYEIGRAIEKGKKNVYLWCPKDLAIPSDLNCYLWTIYTLIFDDNGTLSGRQVADFPGFSARFRSCLYDIIVEKLNSRKQDQFLSANC